MAQHFEVRKANSNDLKLVYQQMILEGWNPAIYDFHGYPNSKNYHMFVGVLDGEVISSCCAFIYHKNFAFFSCYLVFKPELRGKGYGLKTYQYRLQLMKELGVKSIACDAAPEQTHNYAKNGFVDNYLNRRFIYRVKGNEAIANNISIDSPSLEKISKFDAQFLYESRPDFFKIWINNDPTMKFASIHNEQDELLAMGIARQAQVGFRIGPLYANTLDNAKSIVYALAAQLSTEEQLMLDIPEANCHADHFIKELNLTSWGTECMRMYRGEIPQVAIEQIYGTSSLEVG